MFSTLQSKLFLFVTSAVALLALSIIYVSTKEARVVLSEREDIRAQNLTDNALLSIEAEYKDLLFFREKLIAERKKQLEDMVTLSIDIFKQYQRKSKEGKMSLAEAQKEAFAQIRQMRFDRGTGYFWVNDLTSPYPIMLMHPIQPYLEGKIFKDPRYNTTDSGENLLKAAVELVSRQEKGFIKYKWHKPNNEKSKTQLLPKISFVHIFKPWKLMIGAGIYLDDIEADVSNRLQTIKNDLKTIFKRTPLGADGYMFILDGNKRVVIHPWLPEGSTPTNINSLTGNLIVDDIINLPQRKARFLNYTWNKPQDPTNYTYAKKAYIRYFQPLDWYFAATLYLDEINAPQNKLIDKILIYTGSLFLIFTILSWFLMRRLTSPLKVLTSAVKDVNKENFQNAQAPIAGSREITTLGHTINEMYGLIREKISETERANAAKTIFMAMISHEIRTPLNAIIGFSELLYSQIENPEQLRSLKRILECGDSLLETINNVLDISAIEHGIEKTAHIDFNLKNMLNKISAVFQAKAEMKKDLNFVFEYEADLPLYFHSSSTWIRQIVINLLSNSFKFTSSGEIQLLIKRSPHQARDSHTAIDFIVRDTGIGISHENTEKILEPFSQEADYISRKFGGTGLGLYIVKNFIETLEGTFTISSEKDQGTCCTATIPLPLSSPENILKVQAEDTANLEEFHAHSLLVVDDSEDNRTLMHHKLKGIFDVIDFAENGKIACDLMEENNYEFILMDIQMPVMSGYEAVEKIRKMELQTKRQKSLIISLTAHAFDEERSKVLSSGFDDFISKPIKINDLLKCFIRLHTLYLK